MRTRHKLVSDNTNILGERFISWECETCGNVTHEHVFPHVDVSPFKNTESCNGCQCLEEQHGKITEQISEPLISKVTH